MALRTISLCAGIGGLDLGLDLGAQRVGLGGARAVCMVEGEAFAAAILAAAMEAGALAPAPIWSDVHTFDARAWRGVVDCVVGGYPCQPFSTAGKRLGEADPRHLWPAVARVVRDAEPTLCFFENVSGHLSLGAHDVARELQAMGFRVAGSLWTAEEVGAPHRRERLFILAAHAERIDLQREHRRSGGASREVPAQPRDDGAAGPVADANEHARHERRPGDAEQGARGRDADRGTERTDALGHADREGQPQPQGALADVGGWPVDAGWWSSEPDVGRVADGVPARVDRLRALGNAVVPEQAARAFVELWGALNA